MVVMALKPFFLAMSQFRRDQHASLSLVWTPQSLFCIITCMTLILHDGTTVLSPFHPRPWKWVSRNLGPCCISLGLAQPFVVVCHWACYFAQALVRSQPSSAGSGSQGAWTPLPVAVLLCMHAVQHTSRTRDHSEFAIVLQTRISTKHAKGCAVIPCLCLL